MGSMGSVGSKGGGARALFFPPSFGRRCPEGAEVGLGFSLPRSPYLASLEMASHWILASLCS